MSTDIHHNDDQYRKAYQRLEEEPSPEVWNKVMADLDSRDAKYYQQKSLRWKRISLLLSLLLGTITLSGILYMSNQKSSIAVNGTTTNGGKQAIDKTTPAKPLAGDNNTTTQNINQKEIYATAKRPKSDSGSIAATVQPTAPEYLGETSKQDHPDNRKQHPKQVQDTSVTQPFSAIRQSTATAKTVLRKKQSLLVNKNKVLSGKEVITTDAQNEFSYKQNSFPNKAFLISQRITGHSNESEAVNQAGSSKNNKLPFTFLPASALENVANKITTKETVDTNVAAQINAIAASGIIKIVTPDTAATTTDKNADKIAKYCKPRLQLTGYSSLDVTQYHLDNDEHGNNNGQPPPRRGDKHDIEDRESHGFAFSAGLMVKLQATPKLSLKTGISYGSTSINIRPQTLYADRDENQHIAYKFITSSGYGYVKPSGGVALVVGDSTAANRSHQQLQYLTVPLMFGYTAYTGKHISITPFIGAAANFLVSARVQTEINATTTKEPVRITRLTGSKPWYPSLMADAEIQYRIKRNWSITLLPSLRYAISPITQNSSVKTLPYSIGFGVGITHHF